MNAVKASLLAAFLLAGCARPEATVAPGGTLDVLGPFPAFAAALDRGDLPTGWALDGDPAGRLMTVREDGLPALRVTTGGAGFKFVKRVRAQLLATPYLGWSWKASAAPAGEHPVRLIVGFLGGGEKADRRRRFPEYDRSLSIVWSDSALRRGNLEKSTGTSPRYTGRGGRENTRRWWVETVDLSALYAQAWPGDARANVSVTFIGLAVMGDNRESAATMALSAVRLSR